MPSDLELARLIFDMQTAVRQDIAQATTHISDRIDDLRDRQVEQNGRVNKQEALLAAIQVETGFHRDRLSAIERGDVEAAKQLARIDERSKGTVRGFIASLTPRQKTVFWSAVISGAGFLADRGWQITKFVTAMFGRGGQQP
jgi:hypothetical protein